MPRQGFKREEQPTLHEAGPITLDFVTLCVLAARVQDPELPGKNSVLTFVTVESSLGTGGSFFPIFRR